MAEIVLLGSDFASQTNIVLYSAFFHRLVDLRLGKGRIGPNPDFLAPLLLPLNLRQ